MRKLPFWAYRLILIAPAAALAALAIPRLQSGAAMDAAFPVPIMIVMNVNLPANTYRRAEEVVARADSRDGDAILQRAEIASQVGDAPQKVSQLLREGLSLSPASARGWTLLAEQMEASDKKSASSALTLSMLLGPYEYFVAGRRARAAASLWDSLPEDARRLAMRQTRLLWSEALLNREILPLLNTKGGPDLVLRTFQQNPEELRELNRWVATTRRHIAQ